MKDLLADLARRHPSIGAVRSIGLFGVVELVRNRKTMEPMAPFNGTSPEMQALGRFFRTEGLYTFIRWNTFLPIHPSASPSRNCATPSPSSIAGYSTPTGPSKLPEGPRHTHAAH